MHNASFCVNSQLLEDLSERFGMYQPGVIWQTQYENLGGCLLIERVHGHSRVFIYDPVAFYQF